MKKCLLLCCLSLVVNFTMAQTRFDATMAFQTDPAKQYSVFLPSTYDPTVPNSLMLGLHPLNVSRWNSISWCDTLVTFAEANGLILVCPDGGADGAVDDPIDVAFTTAILDSIIVWYNINETKIFAMGFSWGGRTTYSYGLANADRFAGFMPIGAAITGTSQVAGLLQNATDKPFYIIHGSNDSPNNRFFPIRDSLINRMACVETEYLTGVGHTIDFPNRNAILTAGFQWLDAVVCGEPVGVEDVAVIENSIRIFPNPVAQGGVLTIELGQSNTSVKVFDTLGKIVCNKPNVPTQSLQLTTKKMASGMYIVTVETDGKQIFSEKISVVD